MIMLFTAAHLCTEDSFLESVGWLWDRSLFIESQLGSGAGPDLSSILVTEKKTAWHQISLDK